MLHLNFIVFYEVVRIDIRYLWFGRFWKLKNYVKLVRPHIFVMQEGRVLNFQKLLDREKEKMMFFCCFRM
jgi:hypothetical protein